MDYWNSLKWKEAQYQRDKQDRKERTRDAMKHATTKYMPPRATRYCGMWSQPYLLDNETWLEPESHCYPYGGMQRRFRGVCPDGVIRIGRASIPDTFFTIPAKVKVIGKWVTGWVAIEDGVLHFNANIELKNGRAFHDAKLTPAQRLVVAEVDGWIKEREAMIAADADPDDEDIRDNSLDHL